jgi:hypothetical protein
MAAPSRTTGRFDTTVARVIAVRVRAGRPGAVRKCRQRSPNAVSVAASTVLVWALHRACRERDSARPVPLASPAAKQERVHMRIAITMRSFEATSSSEADGADGDRGDPHTDCFAEFHVEEADVLHDAPPVSEAEATDETVQVTVVLRGRRDELEDPALGMTDLILGALRSRRAGNSNGRSQRVIDALGIAVEGAC